MKIYWEGSLWPQEAPRLRGEPQSPSSSKSRDIPLRSAEAVLGSDSSGKSGPSSPRVG